MSNWYIDYHRAQLVRLLSMVVVFGVVLSGQCLLFAAGSRLTTRTAERMTAKARKARRQMS